MASSCARILLVNVLGTAVRVCSIAGGRLNRQKNLYADASLSGNRQWQRSSARQAANLRICRQVPWMLLAQVDRCERFAVNHSRVSSECSQEIRGAAVGAEQCRSATVNMPPPHPVAFDLRSDQIVLNAERCKRQVYPRE